MLKLFKEAMCGERGSALLMSLMVMVGLSLLGLGFVAISETENAISINHRNSAQTQAVAEAGAKAVVEWFQRAEFAVPLGIMPADSAAHDAEFKIDRFIDTDPSTNPPSIVNVFRYKRLAAPADPYFCCFFPLKGAINDRFYGSENKPDVRIAYKRLDGTDSPEGTAFLNAFNTKLFPGNQDVGRVVEILIYAPPILDGNLNAEGFWDNNVGTRYGLSTIKVTAQKGTAANPFAQRSAKIVVSEWPFPGPQGPIQSNANIQTGGKFAVHWGRMTSQGNMEVKRPLVGMPWYDAYTRVNFEHGDDSANAWQPNPRRYAKGDLIHVTGLPDEVWEVDGPAGPTSAGLFDPTLTFPIGAPVGTLQPDAAGITWRKRIKSRWPNSNDTNVYTSTDYLFELLSGVRNSDGSASNRAYDDPWVECRARGAITNAIVPGSPPYHPFKYIGASADELLAPTAGFSNWFQTQNVDDLSGVPGQRDQKQVIFPRIDYEFWKNTAMSGQGNDGVFYLTWVSGINFRNNAGVVRNFAQWTNVVKGRDRGFYFFDTMNNQNPQIPGGTAFLTPAVKINSSTDGTNWMMSGFIYLNSVEFGTTGIDGLADRYNFPGEPYRDVGYWRVVGPPYVPPYTLEETVPGAYVTDGQATGRWEYQDVNGNGKFDLFLEERVVTRPGDNEEVRVWLPKQFFNGCTPGEGGIDLAGVTTGSGNCSEPHEPYLNIVYPLNSCCGGAGEPNPMQFRWENPAGTITRRPKTQVSTGVWPTVNASDICTDPAQEQFCMSNGYDRDGYADEWTGGGDNSAPVLDGVFYCEGKLDVQGNARYFGSMLINGDVGGTGNAEVWFDERLVKDAWPPPQWPFPRVIVTAIETD